MEPQLRAVIDVGTNSVKLLVAEVGKNRVVPVLEQSEQTRLGRGFYESHRLQPAAVAATAQAVMRRATTGSAQPASLSNSRQRLSIRHATETGDVA